MEESLWIDYFTVTKNNIEIIYTYKPLSIN